MEFGKLCTLLDKCSWDVRVARRGHRGGATSFIRAEGLERLPGRAIPDLVFFKMNQNVGEKQDSICEMWLGGKRS